MISEYLLGKHVEVTKDNNPFIPKFGKSIRAIGKTINLGKDYGKSAYTTAPDLGISVEEAEKLFQIIDSKTPKKIEYFRKRQRFVEENGYIITDNVVSSKTWFQKYPEYLALKAIPNRDKTKEQYTLYFRIKGEMERFSQNNPIQGSAALMTKIAHILIEDEFEQKHLTTKAYIVALVHDEIVCECLEEVAEQVKNIMVNCMEKAGRFFCKTIPMKVDPEVGKIWNH